jgi:hypothetical protein
MGLPLWVRVPEMAQALEPGRISVPARVGKSERIFSLSGLRESADFEREAVLMGEEPIVDAAGVGGEPGAVCGFEVVGHGVCEATEAVLAGGEIVFNCGGTDDFCHLA